MGTAENASANANALAYHHAANPTRETASAVRRAVVGVSSVMFRLPKADPLRDALRAVTVAADACAGTLDTETAYRFADATAQAAGIVAGKAGA